MMTQEEELELARAERKAYEICRIYNGLLPERYTRIASNLVWLSVATMREGLMLHAPSAPNMRRYDAVADEKRDRSPNGA